MVVLAVLLLLMFQPDLGSALTLVVVAMAMLFVAGTRPSISSRSGHSGPAVCLFPGDERPTGCSRILAFSTPGRTRPATASRSSRAGLPSVPAASLATASAKGKQKLFYLPEAHTDFIFSVIGEELGFVGVFVIAAMFLLLVCAALHRRHQRPGQLRPLPGLRHDLADRHRGVRQHGGGHGAGADQRAGAALPLLRRVEPDRTLMAVGIILNVSSQNRGRCGDEVAAGRRRDRRTSLPGGGAGRAVAGRRTARRGPLRRHRARPGVAPPPRTRLATATIDMTGWAGLGWLAELAHLRGLVQESAAVAADSRGVSPRMWWSASAATPRCRCCWRPSSSGVPYLIHEQNAGFGLTNRLLARWARAHLPVVRRPATGISDGRTGG